jgi:protein ImuA
MSRTLDLSALRRRIRQIEGPVRHGALPFGIAAIDDVLPGGGLARGAVHEILGAGGDEEDGAAAAGFAAGILARLGFGLVLWCLRRPDLYGPGLVEHGLDPTRLVLVAASRDEERLWAIEEGLRAGAAAGLAAVVGEIGRLPMVAGRRLQLAAERSGITALILRRWHDAAAAAAERQRPSAALSRWRVGALPALAQFSRGKSPLPLRENGGAFGAGVGRARWRVELLRVRGGVPGSWIVEAADATGHASLSAELADRPVAPAAAPATDRRHSEPLRRAG